VAWKNEPPLADAGADQLVFSGNKVILDGSASKDADDGIVSYRWKQTAGPPVTLSTADFARSFFTAPPVTEQDIQLVFQLTVTDAGGLKSVAQCQVTVQSIEPVLKDTQPPVVTVTNPGSSFVITKQNKISLAGTASDNDEVVRVLWENAGGGSGQASGTNKWSVREVRLTRGYNQITVTAHDAAGNKKSVNLTVFVGQVK
jgi:chitinase